MNVLLGERVCVGASSVLQSFVPDLILVFNSLQRDELLAQVDTSVNAEIDRLYHLFLCNTNTYLTVKCLFFSFDMIWHDRLQFEFHHYRGVTETFRNYRGAFRAGNC